MRATSRGAVRLALMPFELATIDVADRSRLARISESLLVDLARDPARVEVIGPRTTARYHAAPFPDLEALARDLDVDYVLNARYLFDAGEAELIVELIRIADGAHPWVDRFDGAASAEEVISTVRAGVEPVLGARAR
jgi:TolB-like protein